MMNQSNPSDFGKLENLFTQKAGLKMENVCTAILLAKHHGYTLEELESLIAQTVARPNLNNPAPVILLRLHKGEKAVTQIAGVDHDCPDHQEVLRTFEYWCKESGITGGGKFKLMRENIESLIKLYQHGKCVHSLLDDCLMEFKVRDSAPPAVKASVLFKELPDYLQQMVQDLKYTQLTFPI